MDRIEGSYNRQRSGHPYRNNNFRNGGGPARINFFRAEYNSHWNGRNRPYWMRRNVSNGYYQPRNNGNRNRRNRGRDSNRRRLDRQSDSGTKSDASNSSPAQSQQRTENRTRRQTNRPVTQPGWRQTIVRRRKTGRTTRPVMTGG